MTAKPSLQPFDGSAIPAELKALRRWAPWRGRYNAERGKWDKIPVRCDQPEYGLSTADVTKWGTFDEALLTFNRSGGMLSGVGLVMTDIQDRTGIDIDNCLDAQGNAAPWAVEVVRALDSYCEISPSGKGLRVFVACQLEGGDWNNHDVGIEVYGGSAPRFLTVTGRHFKGTPTDIRPVAPGVLANIKATYGKNASTSASPKVPKVPMPDLLPEADAPAIAEVDIPPAAREFLLYGELGHNDDGSRRLFSTGIALLSAGLTEQEAFSLLAHNEHAMGVAARHRNGNTDKALTYLWEHHVVKAKPLARTRALTMDDFDDLGAEIAAAEAKQAEAGGGVTDDFDDVSAEAEKHPAKPPAKKDAFTILSADQYTSRVRNLKWFIKGVLPKAELAAIFGASGSGKTFITLDMACRIAMGMDWFGIPTRQSKALYVAAEGASGMRDRLLAWCIAHDVGMRELGRNLFVLGDQPDLISADNTKALINAARRQCPGVELVILDTMAQVTPGANENSGEDMGKFLAHCKMVGKVLTATVVMVGHSGKDEKRGLRGWSGLKGAMDAECEVIRTNEFRALSVTKLKDGKGEGKEYRFTLPEVLVDFDIEDGEVSSLVAQHGEVFDEGGAKDVAASEQAARPRSPRAKRVVKEEARVQFLREYVQQRAIDAGPRVNYEVLIAECIPLCAKDGRDGIDFTSKVVEGHNQKTVVKATLNALQKAGVITIEGEVVTVTGHVVETPDDGTCDF